MEETTTIDDVLTSLAGAAVDCADMVRNAYSTLKAVNNRLDAAKGRYEILSKAYKEVKEYKVMLSRVEVREMPKVHWQKWATKCPQVLDRQLDNGSFIKALCRSVSTNTRLLRMARLAQLIHELTVAKNELEPKIKKLQDRVGGNGNTGAEESGARNLLRSLKEAQSVLIQRTKVAARMYLEVKEDTLAWMYKIDQAITGEITTNHIDVSSAVKANSSKDYLDSLMVNEESMIGFKSELAKEGGKGTAFGQRAK